MEFTDESGEKYKCDGEVGKERWPTHLDFKGQKLHFKFYSDSSNNEWGYKFTVSGCGYMLGWAWLHGGVAVGVTMIVLEVGVAIDTRYSGRG